MRALLEKALAAVLIVLFSATVLTVVWQVVGRYILEAPSSATEEIARFQLIWLALLSATYAFARRMHVGVDILTARVAEESRATVARGIWLACAIFALGVMVYGGGNLVNITRTLGQTSAAMALPMWTIYTVLPISGLMIAYFAISFMVSGTPTETTPLEDSIDD